MMEKSQESMKAPSNNRIILPQHCDFLIASLEGNLYRHQLPLIEPPQFAICIDRS